jgi:hypothetical protein
MLVISDSDGPGRVTRRLRMERGERTPARARLNRVEEEPAVDRAVPGRESRCAVAVRHGTRASPDNGAAAAAAAAAARRWPCPRRVGVGGGSDGRQT